MTDEERKSLKEKIKGNLEALKEHVEVLEFSIQQLPANINDVDRETRHKMMAHKRDCEAQIRDGMKKLTQQEVALKRVDGYDYGICIECEKPIPMVKLELMPETMYCVECHKL